MTNQDRPAHVLVVEDDRVMAKLFGVWLLLEGYTVTVCHVGMKGTRLAHALTPDLVIWDVGLPDGDDMAPDVANVPLIITTGYRNITVPAGAMLLEKPVGAEDFRAAVRKALL